MLTAEQLYDLHTIHMSAFHKGNYFADWHTYQMLAKVTGTNRFNTAEFPEVERQAEKAGYHIAFVCCLCLNCYEPNEESGYSWNG